RRVNEPGSLSPRALLVGAAAFGTGLAAGSRQSRAAVRSTVTTPANAPAPAALLRPSPNAYLSGNFAPVLKEVDAVDLAVRGTIPRELRGRLLRVGPNPIAPEPSSYHWFLGDGMVHGIELRDGRALSYRNRWVVTEQLAAKRELPPPTGPADVIPGGTAANVNIVQHGSHLLALGEAGLPYELTAELGTVG